MRLKIILPILSLIIAVFVGLTYIMPEVMDMQANMKKLEQVDKDLAEVQAQQKKVGSFADMVKNNSQESKATYAYLPIDEDLDEAMNIISQVVNSSGVILMNMGAETISEKSSRRKKDNQLEMAYTAVELTVSGSYQNLVTLLKKLEIVNRHSRIEEYAIKVEELEGAGTILVMEVLVGYGSSPQVALEGDTTQIFTTLDVDTSVVDVYNQKIQHEVSALSAGTVEKRESPFRR